MVKKVEDAGADAHCFWLEGLGIATTVDIDTSKPIVPTSDLHYGAHLRGLTKYRSSMVFPNAKLPIMASGGIST